MYTKTVMTASALILGLTGIILTFMPTELLHSINFETSKSAQILIQILGALYFSFAMLNWMTKKSIIGGIYNRPITIANFTHFTIAGLALIKGLLSSPNLENVTWIIATIYSAFAISFGLILFRHPLAETNPK
jgi:uncharacterized membrane protein